MISVTKLRLLIPRQFLQRSKKKKISMMTQRLEGWRIAELIERRNVLISELKK